MKFGLVEVGTIIKKAMEKIKKYLPYIAIGVLILLIAAIVQILQMNKEIRALNASYDVLNEQLEQTKESNFNTIDSLTEAIKQRNGIIDILESDYDILEGEETDINTRIDENKKNIVGINDADSLQRIISRRYD